ncbi:hypothetical protein ODJ79_42060 [Actinoplanes sp. KI2]|uniref:hypothetical protein n=1 Tax=Actinoplanes sp. KI2 TaxID=2983315 RepID=UPI0021D5B675|nr:hypothetical protein [Actinoplanes sp. KI2]MCU7730344.1 hypothetical protein [Actinoplanes sp. KI2]
MERLNFRRAEGQARPMKYHLVAAAVAASLSVSGLAGCGSGDGHATPAAKASSAHATPVLTVKAAGETYLKLSAASNAAREAWMSAPAPTAQNLAKHKRLAARAADATVAFSQGLRAHRWPGRAQPYVTALDKALQERAAAYRRVAAAGTVSAYLAAAAQVPVTTSLTADVRKALGLPEAAIVKGVTPR